MRKLIVILLPVLLGGAVTFGSPPQSVAGATVKTPARRAVAPEIGWEQEWAKTLALAKQEGTVSIAHTSWQQETVTALSKGFKDKYGINVEFTPSARGEVMTVKLQEQRRAGLNLIDLVGGGPTTAFKMLKPVGLVAPMDPLLILPEVKDPKYWTGGQLPYVDKDKTYMALLAQKTHYIVYNTGIIKPGEIASYKDLLNPKYKGKITFNDPTVTGPGLAMISFLARNVWTVEETKNFLRHLIVDQQAVLQRVPRLQMETVARGKYAIGLGGGMSILEAFYKTGAPIDAAVVKEGFNVSPAGGGISALAKMAHPNAAKVFLNWLLSKEGGTIFLSSMPGVSTRADVPVDSVSPLWRIQKGEKIFKLAEEDVTQEGQMAQISKQVVSEASK